MRVTFMLGDMILGGEKAHLWLSQGKPINECPEVDGHAVSLDMLKSWIAALICYCDKE